MTPEQEEQVRRALSSFTPEEPMPPEVAARLDATLAGLVEERSASEPAEPEETAAPPAYAPAATPLDELAARRRRRRWGTALVAAASIGVLGIGINTVMNGSGGADSSPAALDSAESDDARAGEGESAPEVFGEDAAGPRVGLESLRDLRSTDLRSETLQRDVRRAARLLARPGMEKGAAPQSALGRCPLPFASAGDQLGAVLLDGERATLVLREPVGGTHVAEIYSCDDARNLLVVLKVPARSSDR